MYKNQIQAVVDEVGHGLSLTRRSELADKITTLMQQEVTAALGATAPARLARLILSYGEEGTCAHGGKRFDFKVTQGEMARVIGASRSYTSTVINQWKIQGILTHYGRTTCVRDVKALRKIATGR